MAIVTGGPNDDFLVGDGGSDLLQGLAGADVLFGYGGDDVLEGGDGQDRLEGGDGDDHLIGGASHDVLIGGNGNDLLIGGTGFDSLDGGSGDDTYVVDDDDTIASDIGGYDTVVTSIDRTLGNGLDALFAGVGTGLSLTGNSLANLIRGGTGADTLRGGAGLDTLQGFAGEDTLWGDGRDTLEGGTGDDVYWLVLADAIYDTIVEGAGDGYDMLFVNRDFFQNVAVRIERVVSSTERGVLFRGNAFEDELVGNVGNDRLEGGNGADRLEGGSGDDVLDGGEAGDVLIGGVGADHLRGGGAGADRFVYTSAADSTFTSADAVRDFDPAEDVFDLTAVDADTTTGGDQAFTFVSDFTGVAGQATLRFEGWFTRFLADIDGDAVADMRIDADGNVGTGAHWLL